MAGDMEGLCLTKLEIRCFHATSPHATEQRLQGEAGPTITQRETKNTLRKNIRFEGAYAFFVLLSKRSIRGVFIRQAPPPCPVFLVGSNRTPVGSSSQKCGSGSLSSSFIRSDLLYGLMFFLFSHSLTMLPGFFKFWATRVLPFDPSDNGKVSEH